MEQIYPSGALFLDDKHGFLGETVTAARFCEGVLLDLADILAQSMCRRKQPRQHLRVGQPRQSTTRSFGTFPEWALF